MADDLFITGKEIMDRWGITAFQLQDVLREGELVAVQDDGTTYRTQELDPCLFCDGQRNLEGLGRYSQPWLTNVAICEHAPARDIHQMHKSLGRPTLQPEAYRERLADFPDAPDMVAKTRCPHRWTEGQRALRIEAARFLFFDLITYEKANGLEPSNGGPDTKKEIVESAEALKQALFEKMGKEMGEAELAELMRQMEDFKRFAVMPAKEAAARMEVKMMAHLAPHLLDPPGIPTRRPDFVNGLRTPGDERETPQESQDSEPTNAADYVVWRRKRVRSIHDGQLMLEVQDRWGSKSRQKTMNREDITALVRGEDPPSDKDPDRKASLIEAFKKTTGKYKNMLKK